MYTDEERFKKYNKYGDSNFSWQKRCSKDIEHYPNVILSSPTGSGKTKVFLEWAEKKKCKPIIITAPIKALSNQRYRELLTKGYTVGLETGDIKNIPENCDFICCTQEIYTNKYSNLENITLIMDEFHYIFENSKRARTYIDALHNSKAKNIFLCSATLGDVNKLTEYVNKVSGRNFYTYENNSRITSLLYKGNIDFKDIENSLVVTFSRGNIIYILNSLYYLRDEQDWKVVESIEELALKDGIKNESIIEFAKKGIAGYYGSLLPKEKLFIEKCYEQGFIDTVVGTDALALGVNFPVQNVIFAQLAKYYDGPISKNLFEQLAGRAGRKGYFDEGYVYYCSDLQELEAFGYDTEQLFEDNLEKQNEDLSISLTPNIKKILLGHTTIEEEADFISNYSTEDIDKESIKDDLNSIIYYIKNKAFDDSVGRIMEELSYYDEDHNQTYNSNTKKISKEELLKKKEAFNENISIVYFDEYSPRMNCQIFADILCGLDSDYILNKYALNESFYEMLQFRKYIRSLPKKYRKGLTIINDKIREIDETAIDGFRGSVSVDEISKQLEDEGRLNGRSVMEVLKEQEAEQRMKDRLNVIEEQLRIAEQFGLEEY